MLYKASTTDTLSGMHLGGRDIFHPLLCIAHPTRNFLNYNLIISKYSTDNLCKPLM